MTEEWETEEKMIEIKQAWLNLMGIPAECAYTYELEDHPDGYDGPCACRTCRSYAAEDAELDDGL